VMFCEHLDNVLFLKCAQGKPKAPCGHAFAEFPYSEFR
jgi:hypothetical protein